MFEIKHPQDCSETPIKETKKEEDHKWSSPKKR